MGYTLERSPVCKATDTDGKTAIHTCILRVTQNNQLLNMHVWAVGGNQSTERKPTQALGEHAKPCALIWTKGQISLSRNLPAEAEFKWLRSIQSFLSENPSSKSGCSHCSPVKGAQWQRKNAYWVALILTDCYFKLLEGLSRRQITARLKQDSALDSFDHNCTVFFQSMISQTKSNHTIKRCSLRDRHATSSKIQNWPKK